MIIEKYNNKKNVKYNKKYEKSRERQGEIWSEKVLVHLPFLWKGKSWGSMPFVQESCGEIRDP